jgi:CubicO group peptidase (beta-lactamase class C family)
MRTTHQPWTPDGSSAAGSTTDAPVLPPDVRAELARTAARVPGLQWVVVDAAGPLIDVAVGWADVRRQVRMTPTTTQMAYSMTKTVTAVAILQLVERGELTLEDGLDAFVSDTPYRANSITVRQLLGHTSGIPAPIPLRWVHPSRQGEPFDESAALAQVLRRHPRLRARPGARFSYSNIGYWLLGRIVEQVTGRPFVDHIRAAILEPLGFIPEEMGFTIGDAASHATGYLAKYSWLNLAKGALMDRNLWDGYDGHWLRLRDIEPDGPAFGGLVGSARSFGRFLTDQLRPESILLGAEARRLFQAPQALADGSSIPMTLGWHVGRSDGADFLFKEGGGGGFHGEMRLWPSRAIGSVAIANDTQFDASAFLSRVGRAGLPGSRV